MKFAQPHESKIHTADGARARIQPGATADGEEKAVPSAEKLQEKQNKGQLWQMSQGCVWELHMEGREDLCWLWVIDPQAAVNDGWCLLPKQPDAVFKWAHLDENVFIIILQHDIFMIILQHDIYVCFIKVFTMHWNAYWWCFY